MIWSISEHAYLCMDDSKDCILEGQVFISPKEHVGAITDLDDSAYAEIRNYQKCLVRFFDALDPPHAVIVGYPVELPVFSQARSFFKKALDEAECEFETTHKKVIETSAKGGVRAAIPKNFPYVHVDFALGG